MYLCNLCNTTITWASNLNRHKKDRCREVASRASNHSKVIDQEGASSIADDDSTNCLEMDPDYTDEETNSSKANDEEN